MAHAYIWDIKHLLELPLLVQLILLLVLLYWAGASPLVHLLYVKHFLIFANSLSEVRERVHFLFQMPFFFFYNYDILC